jgi:AraC-like DNA-binding protein
MENPQCPQTLFADQEEKVAYDDPAFPFYLRRSNLFSLLGHRALPHAHEDFEYTYLLKGRMAYDVNGITYHLEAGEGIFVNAHALHFGYEVEGDCAYLCLIFSPLLLTNCPLFEERYLTPYLSSESALFLPKNDKICLILPVFWQLKEAGADPLLYQSLLYRLWDATLPHLSKQERKEGPPFLLDLKQALAYLKTHYSEDVSLTCLANNLAVSPSYLSKLFRHQLHLSPMAYLSSFRLSLAATRLKETDESVKSIAFSSGFHSANFFARSFKKTYGVTPKEYRNLERKKERKTDF